MSAADWLLVTMWVGLTCYVLLGGADFGGGLWDLVAGSATRQRALIEESIGPVWEANHVWLIFVVVLCWSAFPTVFAAVASTAYLPLTLAALGIIARGSAFAFRKVTPTPLFGAVFAASSVLTPFFLGTVAGGIASGRVPPGIAAGGVVASWWNPTAVLAGVLAVVTAAYLAAVYLCADARRAGAPDLVTAFRRRAIGAAVVAGAVALAGILVLRADAPHLFAGLTGRGLPVVVLSAVAGSASIAAVAAGWYVVARICAATAVAALLWAWALAQYPVLLLPDTTVSGAAAHPAVLDVLLVVTVLGAVLLVPSLVWLYAIFQRGHPRAAPDGHSTSTGRPR